MITDFYNGKDSLYTDAINQAIEVCTSQGGGTVLIPNGEFRTAPIRLKSNVNLHLSDSTILKFTSDCSLFNTVLTRIEGIDCYNISPLIYAYGESNIAITGKGKLDGQASTANWFAEWRVRGVKGANGEKVNEKTLLYQMKDDSIPVKQRIFEKGTVSVHNSSICINAKYSSGRLYHQSFSVLAHPSIVIGKHNHQKSKNAKPRSEQ